MPGLPLGIPLNEAQAKAAEWIPQIATLIQHKNKQ